MVYVYIYKKNVNETTCKVSLKNIHEKKKFAWQPAEIMQIWFRWQMVFAGKA